ncbi:MAG: hypothetical protein Fues2KO_53480 [Fuerstiella sp.]
MLLQDLNKAVATRVLLLGLTLPFAAMADDTRPAPSHQTGSFVQLSPMQYQLLMDCRQQLQDLADHYSNLTAVCHVTQTASTADQDKAVSTSEVQVAVQRTKSKFRADILPVSAGDAAGRIRLCDGRESWDLHQDLNTDRYFVYQHGNDTPDCRWEHWWAAAPYSFLTRNLLQDLFAENRLSKITSVRETFSDEGEPLVEIIRNLYPAAKMRPGDELHDTPVQRFLFFRDHFAALKEVEAIGYIVGTPYQSRRIQEITYEPFQPGQPPRMKRIFVERSKRALDQRDDAIAWNVFRTDEFEIQKLKFGRPHRATFDIAGIVDFSGHVQRHPGRPHAWLFLLSGVVFLIGWWVLKRNANPPANHC